MYKMSFDLSFNILSGSNKKLCPFNLLRSPSLSILLFLYTLSSSTSFIGLAFDSATNPCQLKNNVIISPIQTILYSV